MSLRSPYKKIELDTLEIRIYLFIASKIGYSRSPKSVPVLMISKAVRGSYKEVRNRIESLREKGLLEKWTVKHPTQFKISYFRIPYPTEQELTNSTKELYWTKDRSTQKKKTNKPPNRGARTHRGALPIGIILRESQEQI
jgi:hypothetical protein